MLDYGEAGQRMLADAETLFLNGRHGTADHLYGLTAECALKKVLVSLGAIPVAGPGPKSPYKVHADKLWGEYVAYVSGAAVAGLPPAGPNPFHSWRAEHRYEGDATFNVVRVLVHRSGAHLAAEILESARLAGLVT